MNKIIFIILFLLATLIFIEGCISNSKYAENALGFKLPENIKFIDSKKDFNNNPAGDGTHYIEYKFDISDEEYLKKMCITSGFLAMPIADSNISDRAIFQFISEQDSIGYYKVENREFNKMSYLICVISFYSKRIIIYQTFY